MSERVPFGATPDADLLDDPLAFYTTLFCRFLQTVFGSFPKGYFHWEPDENLTEITISDQATIDKEVVERRPAILMARGPMAMTNISLDQLAGPNVKRGADGEQQVTPTFDRLTGGRRHTDLNACTMTYNCLSREGLEAQRIAQIAARYTRSYKRALMRAGMHRVAEEIQIGSESAPGSIVTPDTKEISLVSVSVPFHYQDTWAVVPVDKSLLTRIDMALSSSIGRPAPGAVAIKEPGIYGKVLGYDKVVSLDQGVSVGLKAPTPKKL